MQVSLTCRFQIRYPITCATTRDATDGGWWGRPYRQAMFPKASIG